MSTASKTFTATGAGTELSVRNGETLTYSLSGTYAATVALQQLVAGDVWKDVGVQNASANETVSGTWNVVTSRRLTKFRFFCKAFTSGSAVTTLTDVSDVVNEFKNNKGAVVFRLRDDGVEVVGNTTVSNETVAAAGTSQATGTAMTSSRNYVTASDGTKGVVLPAAVAGLEVRVINTVSNQVLKVYPATGAAINSLGANAAFSLGPDKEATFIASSATQWYVDGDSARTATVAESNVLAGVTAGTIAAGKGVVAHSDFSTAVGAKANPASGTVAATIQRVGPLVQIDFTFTAARIPVTDGGVPGSYGSLKIFDFVAGSVLVMGGSLNVTATAEGAALTTGAGDADFVIGIGTTPISAAADKVLAAAEQNVVASKAITDVGGTGAGKIATHATVALDGTVTPVDLDLNFSGSAVTIDATSTIDITGTATVLCALM